MKMIYGRKDYLTLLLIKEFVTLICSVNLNIKDESVQSDIREIIKTCINNKIICRID